MTRARRATLTKALGQGALAGLAGVAVMTVTEKVEQRLTERPNSHVPGRAMLTLMGRTASDSSTSTTPNHAMHWGTGALLGALRGAWSAVGIRGGQATATHAVVRLAFDQTVENLTGVGAPPATWPRQEQLSDVAHKGVYSTVTGLITDLWIRPDAQSARGRTSH
jgi:hypothetical protein